MQATMRPRAKTTAFLAHTGVPLAPLPMNATVHDPALGSYLAKNENETGFADLASLADLDEILAARCACL
jgi:hypothetical protein